MLGLVTETWFHPDRHIPQLCRMVSLCGDTALRSHGRNGVAVVVNPDFQDDPLVKDMVCLGKDTVNGCFLVLGLGTVKIAVVYNAPSLPIPIDELLEDVARVGRLGPGDKVLLTGDFNARLRCWHDTAGNAAGSL